MWVKICGITTMKAGVAAYEAGADAVGFVFAPSRRQVDPDRAQSLIMGLPPDIAKVGVFVDEEPGAVNAIAKYAGLTHVQLHGSEPPEAIDQIELPVIKAFRIRSVEDLQQLPAYAAKVAGLLLDPYVEGQAGGTGQTLDWSLIRHAEALLKNAGIAMSGPKEPLTPGRPKLILAGGLTPGNVVQAIREANPGGVDVSSGVERDGQKSLDLIYDFTDLAKEAADL
ncbi:MAG TPA: phosphoribosylanthranilate isomerase [Symbiobacteriaceae bacterium]|nr:phosphoribosylanthranilate isomerase [Symbiobacteriaceae bacterium]